MKSLTNLNMNVNLTDLRAHDNIIETLNESSVIRLRQLKVLFLHNNKLSNLPETVKHLQNLRFLKELSM